VATPEYDPTQQANYLRQCLSHDKRPLGIFLGAGCPMSIRVPKPGGTDPLIPDIAGMTKKVDDDLKSSTLRAPYELLCSHFRKDGRPAPTVEQLLSHVRWLRQVAGSDSVRGLSSDELDSVDRLVCDLLARACDRNLPPSGTAYHQVASWMGAIGRVSPVEVFTTNYDLLMEQALESNRVPYFDGFVGSRETFFDLQSMEEDKLPSRWARLWKIHGSLNWHEDDGGAVRRSSEKGRRYIIYPSHLKYDESRRMPYLAMIDRLRAFLKQDSSVLVTSGFSFGDDHLNEIIIQGLQANPTGVAFALLYGKLSKYDQIAKIALNRSNLIVLAADGGIIGTRTYDWPRAKDPTTYGISKAVEWLDNVAKPGLKDAQFTLGDFGTFGSFIDDMLGGLSALSSP